jgi:hypothetical protein
MVDKTEGSDRPLVGSVDQTAKRNQSQTDQFAKIAYIFEMIYINSNKLYASASWIIFGSYIEMHEHGVV